jgi:hypothetical protein
MSSRTVTWIEFVVRGLSEVVVSQDVKILLRALTSSARLLGGKREVKCGLKTHAAASG